MASQRFEPEGSRLGSGADQVRARSQHVGAFTNQHPKPPTHTVAHDRRTDPASDAVSDPGRFGEIAWHPGYRQWPATPASPLSKSQEDFAPVDPPDQADSLARPFNRRAFRIARPARVDIRWRNPCRLALFRLLGWKVRFTHRLLGPGIATSRRYSRAKGMRASACGPLARSRMLSEPNRNHQAIPKPKCPRPPPPSGALIARSAPRSL
jgi:hypothetical protein